MRKAPCPRCGRKLSACGEVDINGETFPTYQCDECLVQVAFMGELVEAALTFALDKTGKPFDPASPDGSFPQ